MTFKILRGTGVTQSLLLEGVLPLSVSTYTGESVIAQGIERGCVNVPLHKVNLVSDLVTGSVVVGTRPTLPIKDVSLLLENDLAGGKVAADPKVTSKLITLVSIEKLEEVSVISEMSGSFSLMMFLCLWLMLLLVVGWISSTHFSASPSLIYANYSASKIMLLGLYQTPVDTPV